MSEQIDHRREAEKWLEAANVGAVDSTEDGDGFPHGFVQSAALMAIGHALLAGLGEEKYVPSWRRA